MFLRSLDIKNYRSLEHVELERLGKFNVLIGRNNAGKSSVINALALLNDSLKGGAVEWHKVLTARDKNRSLEFRLEFEPSSKDRRDFISIMANALTDKRKDEIYNSPLARQIECFFIRSEAEEKIWLHEVRLRLENNQWATILKIGTVKQDDRRTYEIINLCQAANSINGIIGAVLTDFQTVTWKTSTSFNSSALSRNLSNLDPATVWIVRTPWRYLSKAFFFNPFRHSQESMSVTGGDQLSQNGSNLAQVLHTIHNNNRPRFYEIEKFLHAALPNIGMLQTPINPKNGETEIAILNESAGYDVRLHEMGGGVEQLLMIATVLLTTDDESTLFLEEPESHLHAGAQRFLIERLLDGERQIFVTTHSPTFINIPRDRSLYQVRLNENRTAISLYDDSNSLDAVLEDIGSRNSDVLLSDAVLFVEGPGDRRVFEIWSEKLNLSLEEQNVTVVPMGGGSDSTRSTRVRSDVLEGISQKAPVPHLFVLDRDERSSVEINKLMETLTGRVILLDRRELENYLLVPRALLAAIRSKHSNDPAMTRKVDSASEGEIGKLIGDTADNLFNLVLMKRIRSEIAGLRDGLLPRDIVMGLSHKTHFKHFPRIIRKKIETRIKGHLDLLGIDKVVQRVRAMLEDEWSDTQRRLWIAPGEEIIATVFHHFGSEYKKPNDTVRIAREMREDEIADEINNLIRKAVAMTNRLQTT